VTSSRTVVALTVTTLVAALVTGTVTITAARAGTRSTAATEAPDAAGASALARRTGHPVEISGERTETARVLANPSGTRTLEQYVLPVRARRDGRWVPIDTRLVRNPDGSVTPGATSTALRLSGGGSAPLVTAARDGGELSLSWPTALPAPVLDGDTATYPGVLPGVDLCVMVNPVGFSELLVVHDAAAAGNPALRRVRFVTATKGLVLRADPDGGSSAVDANGTAVFTSGTPMMWESSPGAAPGRDGLGVDPAPRRRAMRTELDPHGLTVLPDPALLSAPDLRYPLYIDPSYSAAQYRWTLVSKASAATSYWTDDFYREDARVGTVYGSGDGPWRSFFQVNVAPLARATISRAWFSITMTHTANCAATSVELWHTKTIDPATPVTWTNSAGNWLGGAALDTRSGKANKSSCGQPPLLMEFGLDNGSVKAAVQQAVSGTAGPQEALGFGLRIPSAHEGEQLYWKRFQQSTARLDVEYDTAPLAPTGVSTVPPTPCGTASAPTPLNTTTPGFSGVGYDPNGDNVANDLDILSGDTVLTTIASGIVGSGAAVGWPLVPGGVLPGNQPAAVFSYRARTRDGTLAGPYGSRCYFTVDTTRPAPPTVTSTDYPAGTPVRSVGEAGTVTFTRAAGDADVTGFRYGFSPDATTMWVAVGADGSAGVPVTLWPTAPGDPADVRRTLYVRAVDRAGNTSALGAGWNLVAHGRTGIGARVPADTNGDRRADVTEVVDQGDGRTAVWNLVAGGPGGFFGGYIGWDTDVGGGFPVGRIAPVDGDFDGDGRADVAIFREDPDAQLRLFLLRSDGTRFTAASQPAWTGGGFRLSHLRVVAGDVNGDGYDDIVLMQGLAGNQSRLWVQLSDHGGFGDPVLAWDSGPGNLALAQVSLVAGDFNGDGYADVADAYDVGGSETRLMVYTSDHGRLGAPQQVWDSGPGGFATNQARFVAGNINGTADGGTSDEIVALYDDGNATARLFTFAAKAGGWSSAVWWSSGAGTFDAARARLSAGDFDGDGRSDVAALYDTGGGMRRLYTFTSTGSGFADRQARWEGYVSAATPTVDPDQARRYRIQPTHSGRCLDVPGGSTADGAPLDQSDCVATAGWQQFQVVRLGAAPYFQLKTAAGKCLDVKSWSLLDNAPVVQWACNTSGLPQPNEQFSLDYVTGSGLNTGHDTGQDTVVAIRVVHSGKCLTVSGSSQANGASIVQATCADPLPANQRFFLRADP
jgi:Ricin-type beta-trefoil lectin domain-like/FG-GAP-like repeat